ncbi:MAG: hypothetical protein AAF657_12170 [Acidobacteriota bacterium]
MDSRSDRVRVRLPNGEHAWVSPEAFNLISEREFLDSRHLRRLELQRNAAVALAALALLALGSGLVAGRSHPERQTVGEQAVGEQAVAEQAVAEQGVAEQVVVQAPAEPVVSQARVDGPALATDQPAGQTASQQAAEAGSHDAIETVVRSWAAAWASQDVDTYLSFYDLGFQPPDGESRIAWEQRRRQRILGPEAIAVTVSDIEVDLTGDGAAIARFGQGYRAPGYQDWVLKTLELASSAGHWRIVEERSSLIEAAVGEPAVGPAG